MRSITKVCLVVLGIASCQGVTQNVETLRAERIEIVDDKGAVKMDVALKLKTLEERVQKLEAALEKKEAEQKAAPPPTATALVSATPSAPSAPPSVQASSKPKPKPAPTNPDVF